MKNYYTITSIEIINIKKEIFIVSNELIITIYELKSNPFLSIFMLKTAICRQIILFPILKIRLSPNRKDKDKKRSNKQEKY